MRDFIFASGAWAFYGFIAQNTSNPNEFILAIRGTSSLEEWWDDLTSLMLTPWSGPGLVGYGFKRIYETLRVIDASQGQAIAAMSLEASEARGSFVEQVAATLARYAPQPAQAEPGAQLAAPPAKSLIVAGHSLGSALTTLYTMENASKRAQSSANAFPNVTDLYTFASPRVGDGTFAEAFDKLPIVSWRVVNELDIVPKLPPPILFTHVEPAYTVNSANLTKWTLGCWHALTTYLHLLDPAQPLDPGCISGAKIVAALGSTLLAESLVKPAPAEAEKELVLSVPGDKAATINITINIGSSGKTDGHN
jgi:triacylglycerol lipase